MPEILPRLDRAENESHDRGRLGLAQLALLGLGAYAGLRYFPRPMLIRAADALERTLRDKPAIRNVLPKLYRQIGEKIQPGEPTHLWSSGLPQVRMEDVGIEHLQLESTLDTAIRAMVGRDPLIASADVIVNSLIAESDKLGPQIYRGLRRATVADVTRIEGPLNTLLREYLQGSLHQIDKSFTRLVNQPQIRNSLGKLGMTPGDLARRVTLGPGMFFDHGGRFYGASRFSPNRVIDHITNLRIPFTSFKPLKLLFPTELFRETPALMRLGPEFAHGAPDQDSIIGTFYAAGKIHVLNKDRRGLTKLGAKLSGDYRLGLTASGMARGAAARMQDILRTDPLIQQKRAQVARLETGLFVREGQEIVRKPGLTRFQRAMAAAFEQAESFGIGPTFSQVPFGGRAVGFFRAAFRRANLTAQITEEFAEGVATPVVRDIPERAFMRRLLGMPAPTRAPQQISELGFFERLMVALGGEPKRAVQIGGREYKIPVARFTPTGADIPSGLDVVKPQVGFRPEFYAFPKAKGLSDWLGYQMMRPNWLLEELAGVNIRPAKTLLGQIMRPITHIGLPVYAAYEAARYIEYKAERVFGEGPLTIAGKTIGAVSIAGQKSLDILGVTKRVKEAEELFPGIESSPASRAARFAGLAFGGAVVGAKAKKPMVGLIAGTLLGLWNLGDMTRPSEELSKLYSGEELVPVKRNRWWMLGSDPWEGSEIDFYKRHWIAELKNSTNPNAYSIYGGPQAAWQGSWLPTPENAFLLKNLFDPYKVERRNYWSRPYPVSGTRFQEFPILGPLLGSTVGQLLKPTRVMHPEAWGSASKTFPEQRARLNQEMETFAAQMGMPGMPGYVPDSALRQRMDLMVGDQLNRLFEFSGLTGFMYGFLLKNTTGSQYLFPTPRIADAGEITSISRAYEDKNFGGLLGHTEFLRRFLTKNPRTIPQINPLPNLMPDWLPGSRSESVKDRDYWLNFHRGDAYAKISMGTSRLPGLGYEAVRPLHSEIPGVYDPMDRFLVLADVAPGSQAFKQYKAIVELWDRAGFLDVSWRKEYRRALHRVQERFESGPTEEYKFSVNLGQESVIVEEILGNTRFRGGGRIFELAGVQQDRDLQIMDDSTQYRSKMRAMEHTRGRLEALVGKEVNLLTGPPGIASTPAIVGDINSDAIQMGLWNESKDPVSAQAKFSAGARTVGALWEKIRHADLPGPFDWFYQKLFGRRSAIELYKLEQLEGGGFSDWMAPYETIIKPAARSVLNSFVPSPIIPGDVQERRNLDLYFDRLNYMKFRRLSARAQAQGMFDISQSFQDRAAGTMTGFGVKTDFASIFQALPKTERPYFRAFSRITDPYQQRQILDMIPESVQPIMLSAWSRGANLDTHAFQNPLTIWYQQKYSDRPKSFNEADAIAANYFEQFHIPDENWAGWHPAVEMEDIRVKTGVNEGFDVHSLGAWNSTITRIETEMPMIEPILGYESPTPRDEIQEILDELRRLGHIPHVRGPRLGDRSRITFHRSGYHRKQLSTLDYQVAQRGSLY